MAALELVHLAPPAPKSAPAPTPTLEHSPVVLTTTLIERLATLNAAARDLRAMGYKTVSESLRMEREHPEIRIAHGGHSGHSGHSIGPLLDRGRGHSWKTVGDKRIGHTEFHGVMVCWEEFQR